MNEIIGLKIRELRKENMLTQMDFSLKIGIDNSQLSKIEQGKLMPTLGQLLEISSIFNKSMDWLTGRDSIKEDSINESLKVYNAKKTKDAIVEIQEVPFYDLEATAGLQELFDSGKPHKVLDTIKIPNLPRCDGAISVTGDSMYPLLKSGDIILYKETSVDNIFYGEMYLVSVKQGDWEEYITVKFVQKSEKGDDFVKLVSQNQHHQPKDIKIGHISAIAMIKASIRYNTMF